VPGDGVRVPSGVSEAGEHGVESVRIDPPCARWPALMERKFAGTVLGRSLDEWKSLTRQELGLPTDRPVIATGHQAGWWHPGILAKYIAVDHAAKQHNWAAANLIVDQHDESFGNIDVPLRRPDGLLLTREVQMPSSVAGRIMGRQPPTATLDEVRLPNADGDFVEALRSMRGGLLKHAGAPNAAMQMAGTMTDLMRDQAGIAPMPMLSATQLMRTSIAREFVRRMASDPTGCAQAYNRAASAVPQARLGPLLIRDDYIELPLWRIDDDGRRKRAYDNDAETHSGQTDEVPGVDLLPRALLMTAIMRLAVCDLFIHGVGGGVYDIAMERWLRDWLGVEVAPMATVTATVRLRIMDDDVPPDELMQAMKSARLKWHDPEWVEIKGRPSDPKQAILNAINGQARNSPLRRQAFLDMHEGLAKARDAKADAIAAAQQRVERARVSVANRKVALRRDWAWPLYPRASIDTLRRKIVAGCSVNSDDHYSRTMV